MRAALYRGPGDVEVVDVPEPRSPGPGELTLRVVRAGMCGTDAGEFTHAPSFVPLTERHPASGHVGPTVLGHEFIGEVVAVGPDVSARHLGERVAAGAGVWCGRCSWCRAGRTNLCERYYTLGLHTHGGFAERVNVTSAMCHPIPDGVTDDLAALAQPMAVAMHGVRRAGDLVGRSVVVVGAGGIGAFIVSAVVSGGASPVIAVDLDPRKLDTATRLGAHVTLDPHSDDAAARIAELTGGGAEVVLESSGARAGLELALMSVRRGGRIVLVGLFPGETPLPLFAVALAELELVTTLAHVCDEDLPAALQVLATQDLAPVIDRVIDLEDVVARGLEPLARGEVNGKVVVRV